MASLSQNILQRPFWAQLLSNAHRIWFQHLTGEESVIVPRTLELKRWFHRDLDFDKSCVENFRPTLDFIRESNLTTPSILAAVRPSSALDWLCLVLLFDQIPRNCYRDGDASIVFKCFDPLALEIALRAIQDGIPSKPYFKYRLGYRFWFFLPLMHSEHLNIHEIAVKEYEKMSNDVEEILGQDQQTLHNHEERVLSQHGEAARALCATQLDYEKRHLTIIQKFGRYPHRNPVLERRTTQAEEQYLQQGGETFGG